MSEDSEEQIKALIGKARDAQTAQAALQWSQAACNAASALRAMAETRQIRNLGGG